MPKCGNCKEFHPAAIDVENCYRVNVYGQEPLPGGQLMESTLKRQGSIKTAAEVMQSPEYAASIERVRPRAKTGNDEADAAAALDAMAGVATKEDGPMWPASDAQIDYVLGLQDERRLPDDWTIRDEAGLRKMERDEVSSLITMLKAFPRGDAKQHKWSMPPGRYALMGEDEWWFYQVDKPTTGRWAGYTFIKRLIGAPGDYRKVDMPQGERNRVLGIIERDPRKASLDYGKQAGVCGVCSSPLTNPESLKAGIGPICRGKVGW